MCKIMIMSGITDETTQQAWEFTKAMAKEMSSPNSTEKDGLGYAAIDANGNLFGERWVDNKDAFKHKNVYGSEIDTNILKRYKILNREKVYGNFGVFNENIRSITLHSRSATNTVSYKNTHPFVENHTSVIHNGVIYNDDQLTKKTSTCDSEVILHQYIKHNVANKPGKIRKMVNKLEGYYALGIFSRTSEGRVILDVIKDNSARLDAFFIKELNTVVFATPRYQASPVEDACKTLGFTIVSKYEVKANRLQRMDALTGETIAYESFKPKEFTRNSSVNNKQWNTNNSHESHYPYSDYYTRGNESGLTKFGDVFPKTPKNNNIIDMTSHSKSKHVEAIKERQLEEMILGNKEYTQEEVEEMIAKANAEVNGGLSTGITEEIRDEIADVFNDGGETVWEVDEKLTWHKKTLA